MSKNTWVLDPNSAPEDHMEIAPTPYFRPRVIVARSSRSKLEAQISIWCNQTGTGKMILIEGIENVCSLMSGEYPDQRSINASDLLVLSMSDSYTSMPKSFVIKSKPGYLGWGPLPKNVISWHLAMRIANEGMPSILVRSCDHKFLEKYRGNFEFRHGIERALGMSHNGAEMWGGPPDLEQTDSLYPEN